MSFPRHLALPVLLLSLAPRGASAQTDDPTAVKKAPNVMLIVDTSGSMEYKTGTNTMPSCTPLSSSSERSRWITLLEVLTGSISSANYSCETLSRSSSAYKTLYRMGTTDPIDADYRNDYHRPLSNGCAFVPNSWPTNPFDYVQPLIQNYSSGTACGSFSQNADGLIDSLNGMVRFGLMTFDTLPNQGRGYSGVSADYTTGTAGAWSYFLDTDSTNGVVGRPVGCSTDQPMEVGARNAAAAAWEGKMIAFGNPDGDTIYNTARHTQIQQVLLSTRPYGATPIAGALDDAKKFFWRDDTTEKTSAALALPTQPYFGPEGGSDPNTTGDMYVKNDCRDEFIVLLTDGEPNLDMRKSCEDETGTYPGNCPFDKPEEIAYELSHGTTHATVKTYVVGFAATVYEGGAKDCKVLPATAFDAGGACDVNDALTTPDAALQVCCTLQRIAYNGGTQKAYFADDEAALRQSLSDVFSQIARAGTASATQPALSPGVGKADTSGNVAYRILSSYTPGNADQPWRGNIERVRFVCDSTTNLPMPQEKDASKGDDFSFNVSANGGTRTIVSVAATAVSGVVNSDYSVRPFYQGAAADGAGTLGGTQVQGDPSTFVSNLAKEAVKTDDSAGKTCAGLDPETCRNKVLRWSLGITSTAPTRCNTPGSPTCSLVGDVVHSTPLIVNRPSAAVNDEGYEAFAYANSGRPMMVYTSSNDGYLHGFQLSPNVAADATYTTAAANNERFAFIPPAVLPLLQSQYYNSTAKLLDGVPVVQDVVAEPLTAGDQDRYPFKLQRTAANATSGGVASNWRTILVQAFGGQQGGYFALDITNPSDPTDPLKGPTFLWQLTKDDSGKPLFGRGGATPIITTIYDGGKEIAVAVLPGGSGGTPVTGACARSSTGPYTNIESGYTPRSYVRCWDPTAVGARSLTIVRLDSGEIIKTFRRAAGENSSTIASTLVIPSNIDSPITGVPAAYPSGVGAVADRIFVGDADGTMWRVDVSGAPSTWTMSLFFDGFTTAVAGTPAAQAGVSQPIATRPVLSVDTMGQITVAFSTGDQSVSGSLGENQFIWSLLEARNTVAAAGGTFLTKVKWRQDFTDGEHVLGPMQLLSEVLYFSSYQPKAVTTDVCASEGASRLWGLHYLKPLSAAAAGNGGEKGLSYLDGSTPVTGQSAAPIPGVIFGVNLEFAPTCLKDTSTGADAMIGGTRTAMGIPSPPQLQLTYQTTNVKVTGTPAVAKFATGMGAFNLVQPQAASTIESWGAILE